MHWFILTYLTSSCWVLLWMKLLRNRETMVWDELRTQKFKLGDTPEGIPSFVSNIIGNLTWSCVFIPHMIWVLVGASFYFVRICLMLFRIMFCIILFNKNVKDSLYHAYLASIWVVVSKRKVYRCCKKSREKSECDKMLKLFAQ